MREIIRLSLSDTFSPWLTTSQVWEELAKKAVDDRAKNGSKSRESKEATIELVDSKTLAELPAELKEQIKEQCHKILELLKT